MDTTDYKELCDFLTTNYLQVQTARIPKRFSNKSIELHPRRRHSFLQERNNLVKLIQQPEVEELLHRYHCFLEAHKGQNAIWRSLANEFYWPGMYQTVANFVKHCDRCQRKDSFSNRLTSTVSHCCEPNSVRPMGNLS